jgi:predicted thioesterase
MVGERVFIEATITNMNKRIIETSAKVKKEDDTVIAEGHAKLLRRD